MGSKSSSSSPTTTATTTATANLNLQDVDGPAVATAGDVGSVTITDQGAVQAAFDAIDSTIDDAADLALTFSDQLLSFAGDANTRIADQADTVVTQGLQTIAQATRSDQTEILRVLVVGATIVAGLFAVSKIVPALRG